MRVFSFDFVNLQKKVLVWALIASVLVFVFMALFPSMEASGIQELVMEKFDAFPTELMEAFGLDQAVNFNDIMHYSGYTLQYVFMALAVFGLLLGLDALLAEEEKGSIEFLYAQPLSRSQIFWSKFFSHIMVLIELVFIIGVFSFLAAYFFKPKDLGGRALLRDMIQLFEAGLFISILYFFLGLVLGGFLHRAGSGLAIGIFFLTYILGVLARIKEELELLRYLSFFDYAPPMDVVRIGFESKFIYSGLIICIIFLLVSLKRFTSKDFRL